MSVMKWYYQSNVHVMSMSVADCCHLLFRVHPVIHFRMLSEVRLSFPLKSLLVDQVPSLVRRFLFFSQLVVHLGRHSDQIRCAETGVFGFDLRYNFLHEQVVSAFGLLGSVLVLFYSSSNLSVLFKLSHQLILLLFGLQKLSGFNLFDSRMVTI